MALRELNPKNDFVRQFVLENVDALTGVISAVTSAAVSGFFATTKASDATAADPTLSASGVYIGGANEYAAGTWQVAIDAGVLTTTLCATLFPAGTGCYFIVTSDTGVRVVEQLTFKDTRTAATA